MPENCRSCTLRDANNNNTYQAAPLGVNEKGRSQGGKQREVQVTAKVLFGSVQAISRLKQEEKAARENKRI